MSPSRVTFGADAHRALCTAAWQAHRGGPGIVATDDLLRTLVEHRTPDVPRLVYQVPELTRTVAYSAGPSRIDDGQRPAWSRPEHGVEVEETLREVAWRVLRHDRRPDGGRLYWTDGLRAALHQALVEAERAGVRRTNSAHLILGVLTDPASRAAHRYPHTCQRITARIRRYAPLGQDGGVHPDLDALVDHLRPRPGRPRRWQLAHWAYGQLVRLSRHGLLLNEVEAEQRRQAVRLGHRTITVAHVLLALLDVEERVTAAGLPLPADLAARNTAGRLLVRAGLTWDRAHGHATRMGDDVELASPQELLDQLDGGRWGDPLYSRAVIAAQESAKELALAHRHRDCGTTHLLAGLLVEAGGELGRLLAGSGVDPALLESWVRDDLASIEPAWSA